MQNYFASLTKQLEFRYWIQNFLVNLENFFQHSKSLGPLLWMEKYNIDLNKKVSTIERRLSIVNHYLIKLIGQKFIKSITVQFRAYAPMALERSMMKVIAMFWSFCRAMRRLRGHSTWHRGKCNDQFKHSKLPNSTNQVCAKNLQLHKNTL